jgi:septal ring factor EnvC (AmiA/AmiB activator)
MKPLPGTLDMLDGLQAAHRAFAEQEALLLERIRQLQAEVAEIGRSHAEQAGRIADLESVLATRSALEQAESERIQNQAAEVEARLADAMKREKDLLGELRTALAALLTQREDRARASALEIELQAREESLTESKPRICACRPKPRPLNGLLNGRHSKPSGGSPRSRTHVHELESRVSTLRGPP